MFLLQIFFIFIFLLQSISCNNSTDATLEQVVGNLTSFNKEKNISMLKYLLSTQKGQTQYFFKDFIEQEQMHYEELLKTLEKTKESDLISNENQKQIDNILTKNVLNLYTPQEVADAQSKGKKIQGYMSTCLNAFLKSIPPSFCFKKGADAGRIPSICPTNYQKILTLCYEQCTSGYYHFGGVCYQQCGDYKDIGLICTKGISDWFWKKSYVPHSITFFDKNVLCNDGEYKMGALCYRDCNKIGMTNCGIGACALSSAACAKGILEMAFDFLSGLAEFILFIVTFGASSPTTESINQVKAAKQSLGQAIEKAGKSAMDAAFKAVKSWISNFTKDNLKKFILKKAKDMIAKDVIDSAIEHACSAIGDYVWNEVETKNEPNLDLGSQSFIDKIPIWGTCSKIDSSNGSPNDEIACAKDVLNTAGMVDPTGIISMAAAFLQPICDV